MARFFLNGLSGAILLAFAIYTLPVTPSAGLGGKFTQTVRSRT